MSADARADNSSTSASWSRSASRPACFFANSSACVSSSTRRNSSLTAAVIELGCRLGHQVVEPCQSFLGTLRLTQPAVKLGSVTCHFSDDFVQPARLQHGTVDDLFLGIHSADLLVHLLGKRGRRSSFPSMVSLSSRKASIWPGSLHLLDGFASERVVIGLA